MFFTSRLLVDLVLRMMSLRSKFSCLMSRNTAFSFPNLSSFVTTSNAVKRASTVHSCGQSQCYSSKSDQDPELEDFLAQIRKDFSATEASQEEKTELARPEEVHSETLHELADSWSKISSTRYESFDFSNSRVIYDVHEEELGLCEEQSEPEPEITKPPLHITRGETGVLDIHQLVSILKEERGEDLVVIKMPREPKYVDHMVLCSAMSQRHLNAIATAVKKHYNRAKHSKDSHLVLEGKGTKWVAMDLGNTALHVMSPSVRQRLDLESLWCCGAQHDPKTRQIEGAGEYSAYDFELFDPSLELPEHTTPLGEEFSEELNHVKPVHQDTLEPHHYNPEPQSKTNEVFESFLRSVSNEKS